MYNPLQAGKTPLHIKIINFIFGIKKNGAEKLKELSMIKSIHQMASFTKEEKDALAEVFASGKESNVIKAYEKVIKKSIVNYYYDMGNIAELPTEKFMQTYFYLQGRKDEAKEILAIPDNYIKYALQEKARAEKKKADEDAEKEEENK